MDKKPAAREQMNTRRSPLIGRRAELAAFEAVLKRAQHTVVIVTGEAGTGKTVLLQAFEDIAKAYHWPTAGQLAEQFLRITPSTDESTFYNEVLARFGNAKAFNETLPTAVQAVDEGSRALEEFSSGAAQDSKRSSSFVKPDLVAQLKQQARVLLLIDSYEPKPDFDRWFKTTFIDGLRQSQEEFVLVIADRPDRIAALKGKQDEFVVLGPLDRQDVREHFESLGAKLQPAMTLAEVDAYVEAVMNDPGLLMKLYRLLTLARASDTGEAGSR